MVDTSSDKVIVSQWVSEPVPGNPSAAKSIKCYMVFNHG